MKEPFDKKLSEKIKNLFNPHEEAPQEKEWEKFATAYFNKPVKKRLPVWPWWLSGIAAALLIGFWLGKTPFENPQPSDTVSLADSLAKKSKNFTYEASKPVETIEPSFFTLDEVEVEQSYSQKEIALENTGQEVTLKPVKESEEKIVIPESPVEPLLALEEEKKEIPSIALLNNEPSLETQQAEAYIKNLLSEEVIPTQADKKDPFKLGFLLTPQTVSNTNQPIGLSAGVMSEIAISKRLKIDMGIAFARQNLSTPTHAGPMTMTSQNGLDAAAMEQLRAQGMVNSQLFSGNLISTDEELRFGQLELPINLKYKMFERNKADIFLVSGISNMFYFNQQRVSTLNFVSLTSNAGVQSLRQTFGPEPSDNAVNVGQLLNLAVGFEQNLSKGTYLYLEPFYKFSVGNQTFANQQFSIGGINLRMNFQLKK